MPETLKTVKFHVAGRAYYWIIAKAAVFSATDVPIATGCRTLAEAKEKVTKWQEQH